MKNNNLISMLIIFIIVFSCSKDKIQYDISEINFISIDVKKIQENLNLSSIVENISYTQLETNDHSLIGNVDRILFQNNNIFIWDRFVANKIFIFKDSGKFIKTIGKIGKGPGEYVSIDDFVIDEDRNEIIICDSQSLKLLFFDLNGEFKNEKKLPFFTSSIIPIGKYYLTYLYGTNSDMPYNLVLLDEEDLQVKGKYLKFIKGKDDLTVGTPFVRYKDELLFTYSLAHEVYGIRIEKEALKFQVKYKIDFKSEIPLKKVENKDLSEVIAFLEKSNLAYHLCDYYETEKVFGFSFLYKNEPHIAFFNKETKQIDLSKKIFNDIDGKIFTRPITIHNSNLVSVLYPHELKEVDIEVQENQNPILAFGELK